MKRLTRDFAVLLLALCLTPTAARAHKESDAYLTLRTDASNDHVLRGQWDIALRDLNFAIGIDRNHDGAITWGEVRAHRGAIERYALARLRIKGDGLTCNLEPVGQKIDEHTDGVYDVIQFVATCDKEIPTRLTVDYKLFYDVDPYHRGIVTIHNGRRTAGAVLGPNEPVTSLNLRKPDRWGQFRSFVVDGIWHIWTGIDHLLFILSLLLPAVLVCVRNQSASPPRFSWQAEQSWWPAFVDILKIVSAFTLSHSVTLSLAVLGVVDLPSRLVESGIALSVIVAAANNIYPVVRRRIWLVAFAFGFIHGLGFASALSGLQLPPLAMAASLGGFNVGVEIGQEAVVLAVMPLAYLIRRTRLYQNYVMRWGSWLIILVASGWLIQRAFNIVIPGFASLMPK